MENRFQKQARQLPHVSKHGLSEMPPQELIGRSSRILEQLLDEVFTGNAFHFVRDRQLYNYPKDNELTNFMFTRHAYVWIESAWTVLSSNKPLWAELTDPWYLAPPVITVYTRVEKCVQLQNLSSYHTSDPSGEQHHETLQLR